MKNHHNSFRPYSLAIKNFLMVLLCCSMSYLNAQFGDPYFLTYNVYHGDFDIGDIDNDGDLDVLMGSKEKSRKVVWYENLDTNGNEWLPHVVPVDYDQFFSVRNIKLLDIDQDGRLDFVADGSPLVWYKNNATTSGIEFTENIISQYGLGLFLELADFDNDGLEEIINGGSHQIIRWTNTDGAGNFVKDTLVESLPSNRSVRDIQIVDLDNDGDDDMVVSLSKSGTDYQHQIGWYMNEDGNGTFSNLVIIEYSLSANAGCTNGCYPQITVADFNEDDLPDIVFTENRELQILFQNNNHTFGNPNSIEQLNQYSDLTYGDINGDGLLDIITGSWSGGINPSERHRGWFKNISGNGLFEEVIIAEMDNTLGFNHLITADIENDGDLDIFYFTDRGNTNGHDGIYTLRNEGNGDNFSNPIFVTDNQNGFHTTFPFDIDNDADTDILFFAEQEGNIYWLENLDADSTFSTAQILVEGENLEVVHLVDVDNDTDLDIVAINEENEIMWFEAIDNTTSFADKQIIYNSIFLGENFAFGDIDEDGLTDLVVVYMGKPHFLKNQGGGNFSAPDIFIDVLIFGIIALEDIDADGNLDLVYDENVTSVNDNIWVAFQDDQGNFSTVQVNPNVNDNVIDVKIADMDNDGDIDIMLGIQGSRIKGYFQYNSSFTQSFEIGDLYFTDFNIADLNGDGKQDIYTGDQFMLQLYTPNLYGSPVYHESSFIIDERRANHADFDNDGDLDLFHNNGYDGIVWKKNQLNEGYWIEGNVFLDNNQNCEYNVTIDTSLHNWKVQFENNSEQFVVSTNTLGHYNAFFYETGDYVMNVITPSVYWGSCIQDSVVQVVDSIVTVSVDIPVLILEECSLLGLNMGSGRLRPCIEGYIDTRYCNYGTIPAENAQLEIVPDSFLTVIGSNIPWTSTTDSSYIFNLGNVDVGECGFVRLNVTPDCDSVQVDDILCINSYITPDSICTDSLWDGSTIEAFGTCSGDSVHFQLENIGIGAMNVERQFKIQIVNDDIIMLLFLDTFLLNPGEVKMITLAAQDAVFFMEAEQDPNHPAANTATTLITGCSTLSTNQLNALINNFPNEDGNPFSETYCQVVTGSYDPNEKEAYPKGIGNENLIDRSWELDYTIHFQNTGNDTAFTVRLIDPISEHLDLSTLRIQGGSHDFTWELNTERELVFLFENILLPDSLTNELGSQGYVQFSIQPKSNTYIGTEIKNYAAIYFDFNEPIITNETVHKILTPVNSEIEHLELCEGNTTYGFPIQSDTLIIDTLSLSSINGYNLLVNHIDVLENSITEIDTAFTIGEIFMGTPINQDTIIETSYLAANGCDSLVLFNISIITNIDQLNILEEVKIYPNPAQGEFFIEMKNSIPTHLNIEIFNGSGTLLQQINSRENKVRVDVSNWNTGVFFIKINSDEKLYFQKVVIIK